MAGAMLSMLPETSGKVEILSLLDVGSTIGKQGEKRVVLTFNGKFLPFIEQQAEDNTLGPGPRA